MIGKSNSNFRLKWLPCCINDKSYHSENGVYGYKQSQRRHFEGICLIKKLKIILNLIFFVAQVFMCFCLLDIKYRFSELCIFGIYLK